jgi:capsular polysaccharide biosynthesis protein
MDLVTFVRTLVRRWYITVALIAVAIFGVWGYHEATDAYRVSTTVAVLDPLVARPGQFLQAQLAFDNVVSSHALAERVAKRLNDGTSADAVAGAVSVSIIPSISRMNTSPLYSVTVKNINKQRAIDLANVVIDEAKSLYAELNSADPTMVRQSFQTERDKAEGDLNAARDAWVRFQTDNDAFALPQRLSQQVALVSQLRTTRAQGLEPGTNTNVVVGATLTQARTELGRLSALEPEYSRLTFDLKLAQDQVSLIEGRVSDLSLAGTAAATLADSARQELSAARDRLSRAQTAYSAFQTREGVADLPSAIQSQLSLVNQLAVSQVGANTSAQTMQQQLDTEEQELRRLSGLEQQYNDLALKYGQAQGTVAQIQQREVDMIIGQTIPTAAFVRQLDSASVQSRLWFTFITYALGILVAILLALSTVYVLAYFERQPLTVDEVERDLGAPVLVRLPVARVPRAGRG